jgi:hypothetical protein
MSHSPPNPLPIIWLYPGFVVALDGFARLFGAHLDTVIKIRG